MLTIYKIVIPSTPDMVYIGQTNNVTRRFKDHCRSYKTSLISRAIQAYCKTDAPKLHVLYESDSQDEIDQYEIDTIKNLNTIFPGGYNLEAGGKRGYSSSSYETSDSRDMYYDDENNDKNDDPDRSKVIDIIGNIAFKCQRAKPHYTYIQHLDSTKMRYTLGTGYTPTNNKFRITPRGDWVDYMRKLYGDRPSQINPEGGIYWLISPEEYDELVKTICSDFNNKNVAIYNG
jgi:hypothetical protein